MSFSQAFASLRGMIPSLQRYNCLSLRYNCLSWWQNFYSQCFDWEIMVDKMYIYQHMLQSNNTVRIIGFFGFQPWSFHKKPSVLHTSVHFGTMCIFSPVHHLTCWYQVIKSSPKHITYTNTFKILFFAIYNHDTLCSRQPYYKQKIIMY